MNKLYFECFYDSVSGEITATLMNKRDDEMDKNYLNINKNQINSLKYQLQSMISALEQIEGDKNDEN